jgi:hypothetical protein
MFLFLNSTFPDRVEVALTKSINVASRWKRYATRDVLAAAMRELRARRKNARDLRGIVVTVGPGPFSRVRAGVVVANTLSFALRIPLWAVKADGRTVRARIPLTPSYGKLPTITTPRKRFRA